MDLMLSVALVPTVSGIPVATSNQVGKCFSYVAYLYVFHIHSTRFRKLIGLKLGIGRIFLRNII